jgi:hypothetical protein
VHLSGELPSAKLRILEAQLEAPGAPLCAPLTLCFQIKNVGASDPRLAPLSAAAPSFAS